jgi:hypothetical protein
LSGLKQLGFVSSDGKVNQLSVNFANEDTRKQSCRMILQEVYASLTEIIEKNPTAPQTAAHTFLKRLGRGDSARDKILKLFWYFWKNSGNDKLEDKQLALTNNNYETNSNIELARAVEGNLSKYISIESDYFGIGGIEADSAAINLARSLISFCETRSEVLMDRRNQILTLQQECEQIEDEISRVRGVLDQHLIQYPSLNKLLKN